MYKHIYCMRSYTYSIWIWEVTITNQTDMLISAEISYEELKALVESSNVFLVDVRSKEELKKGCIPGSVHIPGEILCKITEKWEELLCCNMYGLVILLYICVLYLTLYLLDLKTVHRTTSTFFSVIFFFSYMLYIYFLFYISVLKCVIHTSIITYPTL